MNLLLAAERYHAARFESDARGRLVEDRSPAGMSYVEFLCHVHRLIQNKFQ